MKSYVVGTGPQLYGVAGASISASRSWRLARTRCQPLVAAARRSKLSAIELDPASDYPLGSARPDLVRTPGGLSSTDVTLEALRAGRLDAEDIRATPETLRHQAAVALAAGRKPLADNLARAAELAMIPAGTILEIYTALRPNRSTAAELEAWARRLEREWAAPRTAEFVREAKHVYAERGLLASGERAPAGE